MRDQIHFREMALVHETLSGLLRDPYEPLRAAGLRSGQRVLEVGCGPGFFAVPAGEIVGPEGAVTSLDVSPTAVAHVRRKVAEAHIANVEVLCANAGNTRLPPERFDLAFLLGLGRAAPPVQTRRGARHRGPAAAARASP